MNILLTAGPTHEPIDAVRYIGNRSSGKMGAAIAHAARRAGHILTLILGPMDMPFPAEVRRIDVQTAAQMLDVVLREFPSHDLLIMGAAVADYRPKSVADGKIARKDALTLELEPTQDIAAAAGTIKRPDQRTVGFSLEATRDLQRAKVKLRKKNLDLIIYNPTDTMNSTTIQPVLLYADGREEPLACQSKIDFADILIRRAGELFE